MIRLLNEPVLGIDLGELPSRQPPRSPMGPAGVAGLLDVLNDVIDEDVRAGRRDLYTIASPLARGVLLRSAAGIPLPRDAISGYINLHASGQRHRHLHV